ncbi:MAG: lytic transglycosylase domain-containing protein [bacterium]|nr:lytic transglycosylase domain-containing protein [bacterium]
MKFFKQKGVLRNIFFAELVLLFSFLTSFVISAIVKPPKPLNRQGAFDSFNHVRDNYRQLYYFLKLSDEAFTASGDDPLKDDAETFAGSDNQLLRDMLILREAKALPAEKKYGETIALLDGMNEAHPFLETEIHKLYLRMLYRQREYAAFLSYFDDHPIGGGGNNSSTRLQLQLLKINCLSKTGQKDKALQLLAQLFKTNKITVIKDYIAGALLTEFFKQTTYECWVDKFTFLVEKNWFSEFTRERKYSRHPQLNTLFQAEFYYKRKRYSQVKRLLAKVKSPPLLPHKKKLLLKIDVRRKNYENIFDELEEMKESPELYAEVLFDVGSILLIHRQLDLSRSCFSKYLVLMEEKGGAMPSKYWKGLWLSAWIYYRKKDTKHALIYFKKGMDSDLESYRIAGTYWYNRLSNNKSVSLVDYPFSYYYIKSLGPDKYRYHGGPAVFTDLINGTRGAEFKQYIADLKALLEYRLPGLGIEFVKWAKHRSTLSESERNVFKVIESILYMRQKKFYHSFVSFRKNFDCYQCIRLPRFLGGIVSPVRFRKLVDFHCNRQQLDNNLILSLIRQESFFRPHIVSPARANGLMQILYSTGRIVAAKQGMRIKKRDLYNPSINIKVGTKYLRMLLDRYDQKVHLALAAYNAGEHRVDSWLKRFGDVDDDVFIELIPFTETRNYVKHILRNYYYYRIYYGDGNSFDS